MQDMSSDLIRFLQRQQVYSCSSQGVAHRHLRMSQTHPSGGLQGHSKFIVILRHHIRHYFPFSLYWHLHSWCQTPGSLEWIKGTATQCISNHCIFNIMPSRGKRASSTQPVLVEAVKLLILLNLNPEFFSFSYSRGKNGKYVQSTSAACQNMLFQRKAGKQIVQLWILPVVSLIEHRFYLKDRLRNKLVFQTSQKQINGACYLKESNW